MTVIESLHFSIPKNASYVLLQEFSMPTKSGSRSAISVNTDLSRICLAMASLMISVIIMHLWYLCVLLAVAIALKQGKQLQRKHLMANIVIWNSQSSPLSIVKFMFDCRTRFRAHAFWWATAAILAWAGAFSISMLVSPYLVIGNAAPVSKAAIWIPVRPLEGASAQFVRWQALQAPQYLRAIEAIESVGHGTEGEAEDSQGKIHIQSTVK